MSLPDPFLRLFRHVFGPVEFTIRHGVAKGLKRRVGLGFKPHFVETREEKFVRTLGLSNRTVFDVGAYVGMFTLFFARGVGPAGRVYAFEPNPVNRQELEFNVRLNGFENVHVLPIAVGEKTGTAEMVSSPSLTSRGSLAKEWQPHDAGAVHLSVPVESIDALIESRRVPVPDLVKIDVEGYEREVVFGMEKTLREHHPRLYIEIHGPLSAELFEKLRAHGYSMLSVEQDRRISAAGECRADAHIYCERP